MQFQIEENRSDSTMNQLHNIILPEPTLRRLPWYLAYVDILRHKRVKYVSSTKISRALSVDASQIAKDLSFLGVIGAGSLGKALIRDSGLSNYGLEIVAGFDVNADIISRTDLGVPIRHMDEIYDTMRTTPADIGILTVPPEVAQESADIAIGAGIKAIWNFTPYRVKVAEGVVMANTSIYAHLALIFTRLDSLSQQ